MYHSSLNQLAGPKTVIGYSRNNDKNITAY